VARYRIAAPVIFPGTGGRGGSSLQYAGSFPAALEYSQE
jgi:hypothetical protein